MHWLHRLISTGLYGLGAHPLTLTPTRVTPVIRTLEYARVRITQSIARANATHERHAFLSPQCSDFRLLADELAALKVFAHPPPPRLHPPV
eukprot:16444949-Heterocapsa_arctica.AAC.1